MKPEGSLSHSQNPASCPYTEPDRFSPYTHTALLEDPFYYYPYIYSWVFQVVTFPPGPPRRNPVCTSPPYDKPQAKSQYIRNVSKCEGK